MGVTARAQVSSGSPLTYTLSTKMLYVKIFPEIFACASLTCYPTSFTIRASSLRLGARTMNPEPRPPVTGRSSVRSELSAWNREVAGSNPAAQTTY